jgi:hypothetical protein
MMLLPRENHHAELPDPVAVTRESDVFPEIRGHARHGILSKLTNPRNHGLEGQRSWAMVNPILLWAEEELVCHNR